MCCQHRLKDAVTKQSDNFNRKSCFVYVNRCDFKKIHILYSFQLFLLDDRSKYYILYSRTPKPLPHESEDEFALHKIAFQWYPVLGVFLMIIPAIIISHLTGGQDLTKLNIQLLSPCAQKFMPKKYRHFQLKRENNGKAGHENEDEKKKSSFETKWTFKENDEVKLN